MSRIKLVVFDMAGTTVDDEVDGLPLVLKSYDDALRSHGVEVPMEALNAQRGRDKWTVIKELGGDKAEAIYSAFIGVLSQNITKVREVEGTADTFRFLREHGVRVVASTGFPVEIAEPMIEHLGWLRNELIDGWVCSEQVGASRPDPAMIVSSMKKYGVSDPRAVMKVDDTVKGIEEGVNAGVYTVGVLTGTQSIQQLSAAGPDTILRSVAEIPAYLVEKKLV
ncbi:HAD-IA family hydrolase [Candidatus Bathyarchaeota archaeon]|nr:HAD-IA family hydrolase [Candidatus Bathyarchaeota archaeon]